MSNASTSLDREREHALPHAFDRAALAGLSFADQVLFERFGQGPSVRVPFACLHHAFELHAALQPHALAAIHGDVQITYRELDRHANRLAAILVGHGVRRGDRVALFVHRSIPMLVGILATLKAGAAYVPQHVEVAPERQLRHVVDKAATRVILTLTETRHLVPAVDGTTCIAIDEVMASSPSDLVAAFPPAGGATADDACFVLFTSGTTGMPNGVTVTHRNVANILLTPPGDLDIRPGMRVAQLLSIAFDMSAWEIFGCLTHGGTLIIRGASFEDAVRQADVVIATPSILGKIDPTHCTNVRVVAVAGEPCPRPLADAWAAFATFYNSCGPTEVTIVNTMHLHRPWSRSLTIGKPTPNNTVYILDEQLHPLPIGETGEMWAGGDCVTVGYLDNPALDADRYRLDPFLGGGRRMFRTRDLGRWTADGELEHLGRTDDQVKVRGFRVELDSVSRVIEGVPGCTKAVTLKLDDRTLVAFACPRSTDPQAAIAAVGATLPYYCVPAAVVPLDEVPLTARGKVDKRVLLELAASALAEVAS
ncbi:MAG: amino acid adenylation domain-containing protein [Kofleriaceae bacterium]